MNPWKALVVGVAGGVISGFFGVGGGIVLVPLLLLVLKFDQHKAHATSLSSIFIIALAGLVAYVRAGAVDLTLGVALGVGGMMGAVMGARLMNRLQPNTLRRVFAVVLVVAGLRMVV